MRGAGTGGEALYQELDPAQGPQDSRVQVSHTGDLVAFNRDRNQSQK